MKMNEPSHRPFSGKISVGGTVRFNSSSNGFLTFWYRTVLVVKRTMMLRGSRLIGSDCMVRSESKNLGKLWASIVSKNGVSIFQKALTFTFRSIW